MNTIDEPIKWAGVVILQDRRLLTLKEEDKSFNLVPGGKLEVDLGESDEQAADREVYEELGVHVTNLAFLTDFTEKSAKTGEWVRFRLFTGVLSDIIDLENLPNKTERIDYIDSSYAEHGIQFGGLLMHLVPFLVEHEFID